MSDSYEFNFFFLWKNDTLVLSKVKTIIQDFHGVNFLLSLSKSTSEDPKVGLKIIAQSNKKFSIKSSYEVSISKKSIQKKFFNSGQFVFNNDHDTTVIYPGILMSEVENYLIIKNEKKVIEIFLSLHIDSQNDDSKQKEHNKSHKEKDTDYDKSSEYDEANHHNKSHRAKESHTNIQKDENKKTNSKDSKNNIDDKQNNEKLHKKSRSQLQMATLKDYDYSDEKSGDRHPNHEKKSTSNNKPRRSTQSQASTRKKNYDDYDEKNEYDQEKREKPKRTSKSQSQISRPKEKDNDYDEYKSDEKKQKSTKSRRNKDDYEEQKQTHKSSKKTKEDDDQRHKSSKKTKGDDNDIESSKKTREEDDQRHKSTKKTNDDDNDIESSKKTKEDDDQRHKSTKKTKEDDDQRHKSSKKTREEVDQRHKSSKKTKEDDEQKHKSSKRTKGEDTDIESSKKSQSGRSHSPRRKKESASSDDDGEQKLQSAKTKSQSQSQITKRRKSVNNYENEEDSQKVQNQRKSIKNDEDDSHSEKRKRRSKSEASPVKKKEQSKEEEEKPVKTTKRKTETEKRTTVSTEKEQKSVKTTNSKTEKEKEKIVSSEKEEQNTPKKRKASKPATKKNNENETEKEKEEKKNTKPTTENESKMKKDEESSSSSREELSTSKEDNKNKQTKSSKENDDNHIITNETCPFIGLSNLGATCYMNSAIQVLFHTPLFRKNVLTYDSGVKDISTVREAKDASSKCKRILINLQNLFYQMCECMNQQCNHKKHKDYISTMQLTQSFGWNKQEISMQQDVHEFIINFFEVLDSCSKNTEEKSANDGSITELFKGRIITSITSKKDGKLVLQSFENFYDFSLLVKGNNDIYQSLNMFTEKDELKKESNNQEMIQVQFYSLPKVLHIHLRRFVYSQEHCRTDKVNDYFSFPENLDMSPYVFTGNPKNSTKKRKKTDDNQEEIVAYNGECNYSLYGVIVHQGKMSYIGHYYAYLKLNPDLNDNKNKNHDDDNWYLFNDTKVSKVTKEEAMDMNFGEKKKASKESQNNNNDDDDDDDSDFHCAYILLYVRNDAINEIFNIRNCDIKIPPNIISCIDSINNKSSLCNKSSSSFTNVCTNSTVGFTLITEDCIRMNCKLGKAGIDNRTLCKRVNVPFDQIFTISISNNNDYSIGGLYATVSLFLNIDLRRLKLWTVTSSYEIKEPLSRTDFEITKDMPPEQVEEIKQKAISLISPRVIFVEVNEIEKFDKNDERNDDETEETEESSSVTNHNTSIVTKLYTRETQCPMLYTGVLSNLSYSHSLNSIINHHYKKKLLEITCSSKTKEKKFCKAMIDRINFDVYYEKKRSNIKGDSDLFKLNQSKSLNSNNVPKGAFLIFSINSIKPSETSSSSSKGAEIVDDEMLIRWINDLIVHDKSLNKNYEFLPINKNNDRSETVHRYCDMMLTECPSSPIDFCNLFTNTETFDVYSYADNSYFGKVELPNKLSINQLSDFIAFQFDIEYNSKESKMLFFGDGPALRPIEVGNNGSGSNNESVIFHITENIRKSFYFDIVPRTFKYNDMFFTLSVAFSEDSVSLTKKFNFFVETYLQEDDENNEADQAQNQAKNQTKKEDITAETFDNIINKVIEKVYPNSKNSKNIPLNDLRCYWVSKETGQIVSDFITINSKKKKIYIKEIDILFLNRELRIEVTPKDQMSEMKSIKKVILKSKNDGYDYSGIRLEVYKSYVQDNFDGFDENENNNSLPLLKVFDFPFILVNVDPNSKVKKLKEQITQALSHDNDKESSDYLSIKYASLFIPSLEKNLFDTNQNESSNKNDNDYFEDDNDDDKAPEKTTEKAGPVSLIKNDYKFAFDANSILKNDDKIHLLKNQPNKLFLVYTQDRALGNANEGVVFF